MNFNTLFTVLKLMINILKVAKAYSHNIKKNQIIPYIIYFKNT